MHVPYVQSKVETTDEPKTNQEQIDDLKHEIDKLQYQLETVEKMQSGFVESLRSLITTAQYMFGYYYLVLWFNDFYAV